MNILFEIESGIIESSKWEYLEINTGGRGRSVGKETATIAKYVYFIFYLPSLYFYF